MKLVFDLPQGAVQRAMRSKADVVAQAAGAAARQVAPEVKRDMRAAIVAGGLGQRFANALRVDVYPEREVKTADVAIYVHHNISYSRVFAEGATIGGSPYLWLPLDSAPRKAGGRKLTAANYRELIGAPLVSLRRPGGRPLLAASVAARTASRGGRFTASQLRTGRRLQARGAFARRRGSFRTRLVPLYVGIPSVHLRKRIDVDRVIRRGAGRLVVQVARNIGARDGAR